MSRTAQMLATVFGVGYLKPAPGTWGSLAALPIFWSLHTLGGFPMVLLSAASLLIIGIWAVADLTEATGIHDPGEVVIDEVVGQMIALFPLSWSAWSMGIDITRLWPGWIAAFLLFRLFDILKPGPVGWADRQNDAVGVMLDDVIAGAIAAIGVIALAALAHGVIGL